MPEAYAKTMCGDTSILITAAGALTIDDIYKQPITNQRSSESLPVLTDSEISGHKLSEHSRAQSANTNRHRRLLTSEHQTHLNTTNRNHG